nr:unnamed protein product [Callosobruchus analis]
MRCIGIVNVHRNRTWQSCTANLLTNLSLRYGGDEVSIILWVKLIRHYLKRF